MAFKPENSIYEQLMTDAQKEALSKANSTAEMKEIFEQIRAEHALTHRDPWNPSVEIATNPEHDLVVSDGSRVVLPRNPLAPVQGQDAGTFSRTETIGATTYEFAGFKTEHELNEAIIGKYKELHATSETPTPVPSIGEDVMRQNDLERDFKAGRIDRETFVSESGAIDQRANERTQQDWASASQQFLAQHAEWPGGTRNLKIMNAKVLALGLMDADDKLGALNAAYAELVADETLFPADTPSAKSAQVEKGKYDSITNYAELRAAVRRDSGLPPDEGTFMSGGMWGTR